MNEQKNPDSKPAIVLSGGGARGAYEAGIIHYIRTQMPESTNKKLKFSIYSGSSVGAINVAFLASSAHDYRYQGNQLVKLWANIHARNIYKRGPITLGKILLNSALGAGFNLLGLNRLFTKEKQPVHFHGLLNTRPFFHFLLQNIKWPMISQNIQKGHIDALAISATNTLTGDIELFLDHPKGMEIDSRYIMHSTKISPRHVMASAALPVLFPSVNIHNIYYNDGGLRMNTPLTPATHLGATDLMIIATSSKDPQTTAKSGDIPALGDLIGSFIYSILQDRLQTDERQLRRINRILESIQEHTDQQTYEKICTQADVQPIKSLLFYPSQDITGFVDMELKKSLRSLKSFGMMEKSILRMLEINEHKGSNLLSYFLFEPTYIQKLLDLGYEDAKAKRDDILAFADSI